MYKMMLQLSVVTSMLLLIANAKPNTRPPYIDCVNSNECLKNECCVIGMGRFSIPTCKPMGEAGESCALYARPNSLNVTYPDNAHVMLKNVFYNICPCRNDLICKDDRTSNAPAVCAEPSLHENFNDVDYY